MDHELLGNSPILVSHITHHRSARIEDVYYHLWLYYMSSGDPDSGHQACAEGLCPTETSLSHTRLPLLWLKTFLGKGSAGTQSLVSKAGFGFEFGTEISTRQSWSHDRPFP